jgi:hypothetical protein
VGGAQCSLLALWLCVGACERVCRCTHPRPVRNKEHASTTRVSVAPVFSKELSPWPSESATRQPTPLQPYHKATTPPPTPSRTPTRAPTNTNRDRASQRHTLNQSEPRYISSHVHSIPHRSHHQLDVCHFVQSEHEPHAACAGPHRHTPRRETRWGWRIGCVRYSGMRWAGCGVGVLNPALSCMWMSCHVMSCLLYVVGRSEGHKPSG